MVSLVGLGLARTFFFRLRKTKMRFFCLQSKNRAQFGGVLVVVVVVLVLVTFGLRVRSTQNQGGLCLFTLLLSFLRRFARV